jgi:hypothetical protein
MSTFEKATPMAPQSLRKSPWHCRCKVPKSRDSDGLAPLEPLRSEEQLSHELCANLAPILCSLLSHCHYVQEYLVAVPEDLGIVKRFRGGSFFIVPLSNLSPCKKLLYHGFFHVATSELSQFTKICKSPKLTVMFSGIKICVSSSMPIRPYP